MIEHTHTTGAAGAARTTALLLVDLRGSVRAMNAPARALASTGIFGGDSAEPNERLTALCQGCAESGRAELRFADDNGFEWQFCGEMVTATGDEEPIVAVTVEPAAPGDEVYRRAFHATPNPIIVTRLSDHCVVAVNAAVQRLSGYSAAEMIGRRTSDVNLWVFAEERERLINAVKSHGRVTDLDVTLRHRRGMLRIMSVSAELIEVGGETCMITIAHDVTDRRLIEQQERESRQRYQALMDNSPSVIFLKTREGKYLVVNRTFERVLGVKAEQVIGRDDDAIAPPAVAEAYRRDDERLLQARAPIPCDDVLVLPSGVRRFFTVKFPLFDERGEIYAIGGIATDFTERYHAEAELERKNDMLSVIRQSQAAFISGAEPARIFADLLEAFLRLTGSSAGRVRDCSWVDGRQVLTIVAARGAVEAGTEAERVSGEASGAAGRAWVSLPFSRQGRLIGVVELLGPEEQIPERLAQSVDALLQTCAVLIDAKHTEDAREKAVASERALEAQLRESAKMQAIGTLAGGIAHDFNNILTGIFNGVDLALAELPRAHVAGRYLGGVRMAANRAKNLVQQILTFSRRTEQKRLPLGASEHLREAMEFLRATIPAPISLEWTCDDPELTLRADPTQLHQVLINLGTNAAYAMRRRGGELRVRAVRTTVRGHEVPAAPGDYVRITVADTGEGMDRATLERIFEPFFTTKPAGEGTGLGLSVVHGIMKSHDGAITVESTPGEGTRFHLYFPAVGTAPGAGAGSPAPLPVGRGERILWVDDERMVTETGSLLLERLGYRVATCNSPELALTTIAAAPSGFDVAILDLSMPGLPGDKLAQRIRALRADARLILMTGFNAGIDEESARRSGFRQMIIKPFTLETLARAVREVIEAPAAAMP